MRIFPARKRHSKLCVNLISTTIDFPCSGASLRVYVSQSQLGVSSHSSSNVTHFNAFVAIKAAQTTKQNCLSTRLVCRCSDSHTLRITFLYIFICLSLSSVTDEFTAKHFISHGARVFPRASCVAIHLNSRVQRLVLIHVAVLVLRSYLMHHCYSITMRRRRNGKSIK